MAEPVGRVSISRCAELLTSAGDRIDRSALSRYCDAHGLKLGKVGRDVVVDYEAVRAHRAGNYQREVMSGQVVPPPVLVQPRTPSVAPLPVAEPSPGVVPVQSATQQIANMEEHRGLKAVQLRRELREEAREEGLLTETAEVDAATAEAIVEMRAALASLRGDLAEKMVAQFGLRPEHVRPMREFLRRYDREGQQRFAARMARLLRDGNEDEGEAVERLTALAAVSITMRARRNRAYARAFA